MTNIWYQQTASIVQSLENKLGEEQSRAWLNRPHPALGNVTPGKALQDGILGKLDIVSQKKLEQVLVEVLS